MDAQLSTPRERKRSRGAPLSLLSLFLLGSALFITLDWMHATFGKVSIDQIRFVYHSSLSGVDVTIVQSLAWRFGALAVLCLLYVWAWRRLRPHALARKLLWGGTALYAAAALVSACGTLGIASLASGRESALIAERYVVPSTARMAFPETKRNLIIILAESAEHTFNDPAYFPRPVMPELDALAREHVSFRGHVQVPGTQWTIAGITSFFFGIPLRLPLFDWNDYSLFDTFLPGAESILKAFADEGYEIAVILGSDAAFSGKKNLFGVHAAQARLLDINHFRATRDDVDANQGTGWGLADSYIFDRAREYIQARDAGAPLFLIVETVDTHSPELYVAPDDPRPFGDERDAFAALSRNIAAFAGWLAEQEMWADTTLVVLGDHQVMAPHLADVDLSEARREVYNVIINGAGPSPEAGTGRTFASFDLCPTILESVGVVLPGGRYGIGSSLYRAAATLLEELGAEEVVSELELYSPYYMNFYSPHKRSLADSRATDRGAAPTAPEAL